MGDNHGQRHDQLNEGQFSVEPDRGRTLTPGKRSLTQQLSRASSPAVFLNVSDPATAAALVAALRGGGLVQRKTDSNGVVEHAEAAIDRASSSVGTALPDPVRAKFENSLGVDLGGVRVHTGGDSAVAARTVGAKAYATGQDIHFASGQYNPDSPDGLRLLAHEVAHTVQQRGAPPVHQNQLEVSSPGDAAEIDADRAADAMISGTSTTVGSTAATLARAKDDDKSKPVKTDKASWAEKSVDMKLFGKSATFKLGEGGVTGSLQLTNLPPAKATLLKISEKFPIQVAPAVGVMVEASGEIKMEAAANVTMAGGPKEFPGPRENNIGYEAKVTGGGSLSFGATGRVAVVGYVGAGFANINAGGYVTLGAKAKSGVSVSGSIQVSPEGTVGGSAGLDISNDITVTGTGGLTVGWEALIASGTFYEVELASHDFFEMGIKCKPGYDFATGAVTGEEPEITPPKWKPLNFSQPKKLTPEEKKKYQHEDKQQQHDRDGGSGSGPGVPPEAHEDD